MKDGATHLAYKPEHAVDLDTGVIVAAPIHPADEGSIAEPKPSNGYLRWHGDEAARQAVIIGAPPDTD